MVRLTTVIPVFNGATVLPPTFEAINKQTCLPDRLILLDNCSTDHTKAVFTQYQKPGYEWHQNEKNIGLIPNVNRALQFASQTEYLHVLTADDLIKPTFYEKLMGALKDCTDRALAYCPYDVIDENGAIIVPADPPRLHGNQIIPLKRYLARQSELQTVLMPAVLLKTCHLPMPAVLPEDIPQVGDGVFYADWGRYCQKIVLVPEVLCQYRRHSGSTTNRQVYDIDAWVNGEWLVMQRVSEMLGETGFRRWLRQQRLKCLFAARSQVKVKLTRRDHPEYARNIQHLMRQRTSLVHRLLGCLVVALRDNLYALRGTQANAYKTVKTS